MGMWALEPWGNDTAADWYGGLMDRTKLREAWLEGINENADPDVVRAAGALFVMLGRVCIWPIKDYDEDLELAIAALSRVAEYDDYQEESELIELITKEVEELKSRRKASTPQTKTLPQSEPPPWWKFW
jgi:hypothetical protein